MSLVGSLEDLGLGDILQIVSLSRKSGLLLIHSEAGEGRIVFCDGLVRAAYVKGEPESLRSLLVDAGFTSAEDFDRAAELSSAHDMPVAEALCESTSLTQESLDSLRRRLPKDLCLNYRGKDSIPKFSAAKAHAQSPSDAMYPKEPM
jgi:hypothetical protein